MGTSFIDNAIDSALTYGRNGLGCVVVFAAGNDNTDVQYPANCNPDIIAVGAINPCGERKDPSSCDGESWYRGDPYYDYSGGSNYGNKLDLVAPGVFIPTTDLQGSAGYNTSTGTEGDYLLTSGGTSIAAPHVSGIAALILSINPDLTQDEVRDIIESTCTKVGSYSYSTTSGRNNGTWNNQTGYGCVNAYNAVEEAIETLNLNVSLSGSSIVCSSGATFTVSNYDTTVFDSIIWVPGNDNLTVYSGQYTNSPIIKAIDDGVSGLSAWLVSKRGYRVRLGKYLWAGAPVIIGLDGPMSVPTNQDTRYYPLYGYQIASPTNFEWNVTGGASYNSYGWSTLVNFPNPDVYHIIYRGLNTCGWGDWYYSSNIQVYSSRSLSVTPNPTSGETIIAIETADKGATSTEETAFDETAEWELEIFDNVQNLKAKKTRLKGKEYRINTSGWMNGVYMVRVKYKDEVLIDKLIVKR